MARLAVLSGREVCGILQRHGYVEVRRRGSHVVMQKRLADTTITVPVPDHQQLRHRHAPINHQTIGTAALFV